MKKQASVAGAVASILAVGVALNTNPVPDQPKEWEKCVGIANAGKMIVVHLMENMAARANQPSPIRIRSKISSLGYQAEDSTKVVGKQ